MTIIRDIERLMLLSLVASAVWLVIYFGTIASPRSIRIAPTEHGPEPTYGTQNGATENISLGSSQIFHAVKRLRLKRAHKKTKLRLKTADAANIHEAASPRKRMQSNTPRYVLSTVTTNGKTSAQSTETTKTNNRIKFFAENKSLLQTVVHFDLKGAPPKMKYLLKLLPIMKREGVTGLLLEYEDTFPFNGKLSSVRAINSYTDQEIQQLLTTAKANGLQVIPLVQTFGHLEMALKLHEFSHLREREDRIDMICPSQKESWSFLTEYIDQVARRHKPLTYLHIGCDEVYYLGVCKLCQQRAEEGHGSPGDIFLSHLERLARYINSKYPGVVVLAWHDMIYKTLTTGEIYTYNISNLIQPVIWDYSEQMSSDISFYSYFSTVWGASAFKGAQKPNQMLSTVTHYVQNNVRWGYEIHHHQKTEKPPKVAGFILTGWQRFNHMRAFCELMPVGLPSLFTCLQEYQATLQQGENRDLYENIGLVERKLGFANRGDLSLSVDETSPNDEGCNIVRGIYDPASYPSFPGGDVFALIHNWCICTKKFENIMSENQVQYTLSDGVLETGHIFPNDVDDIADNLRFACEQVIQTALELYSALSEIYDEHTVWEWGLQNLRRTYRKANYTMNLLNNLKAKRFWRKRYEGTAS